MGYDFIHLPVDIILSLEALIPHSDCVSLSSTCSALRKTLGASIFRGLRITNDDCITKAIHAIARKYGSHVRKLHFSVLIEMKDLIVNDYDNDNESVEEKLFVDKSTDGNKSATEASKEGTIPESIMKMLSNGQQLFPMLEHISITFRVDNPWELNAIRNWEYEGLETLNMTTAYSLMDETYKAVSQNAQIKSLSINGMFSFHSACWSDDNFQKFLQKMESCELGFWGYWDGHESDGVYEEFCSDLMDFDKCLENQFVNNLKSVTSMCISFDDHLGFASAGQIWPYNPLPLKPGFLPNCRHLKLVNCFLRSDVKDFIVSLSKVLQTLKLEDCHAIQFDPDAFDHSTEILWEEFFNAIVESEPILSMLIVKNDNVPLTQEETYGKPLSKEESKNVRQIREKFADPLSKRKLFSYTWVESPMGMSSKDHNFNISRFLDRGDQVAYDHLRKLVETNSQSNSVARLYLS
jgi:hypothetical protein